jgi:succinyl-CoA synthetase alpha subunit
MDETEVFQIHQCVLYGTQVVAWVKAGHGGKEQLGLPVFESVQEARKQTSATMSFVFLPPPLVADAIIEAIEGGIETIICFTKEVPYHDLATVRQILRYFPHVRLIGPGSCGIMSPSQCKAGVMPSYVFTRGPVGIVSCGDTLGYETAWHLTNSGLGQSTFVGIGTDPLAATSIADVLKEFERDVQTEAVVVLAEDGMAGIDEFVEWAEKRNRKPLIAYIAGHSARRALEERDRIAPDLLKKSGVVLMENVAQVGTLAKHFVRQGELI